MHLNVPKNFIWGTATAAHQVEGNNSNSDFWLLENTKDSFFVEPSGIACDQWNKYKDDIDIISENLIQSYRLSIEWARIEPNEGEFSQEAIDHYKDVLIYCHKKGIKTCVTYQHFTSPIWFSAKGGWENMDNVDNYVRYSEKVTKELGNFIDMVCTINEANLTACLAHSLPNFPEGGMKTFMPFINEAAKSCNTDINNFGPFLFGKPFKTRDCMLKAHSVAKDVIKSNLNNNQPVGITLSVMDYQFIEGGEKVRNEARSESIDVCLDMVKNDDFVGIQTYTKHTFDSSGIVMPDPNIDDILEMGYEYYPESLENVLRYVDKKVKCPIYITENGIGTDDDQQRIKYMKKALSGLQNCLNDGIDIRGYFYWSLLDNFEWLFGYKPRFGLVEVNRDTLERKEKESLFFYKSIIKNSYRA